MRLRRAWRQWWFFPVSPVSLGLFRIPFGLIVFAYGMLLLPYRVLWFSPHGTLTTAQSDAYNTDYADFLRIDVIHNVPDDRWLTVFFGIFLVSALCLSVGLATRFSALLVFIGLSSLHNRDEMILNSGDTVMIILSAYLLLAPAGAACSIDRLIRVMRGIEGDDPPNYAPWVQRLMQLQIATIYCSTWSGKMQGSLWRNGTAAYYPLHMPDMARFPVPWMDDHHLWMIRLLTWGTLATELSLWTLIWVPRFRLYVLVAGIMLHLGIEYSLNVPLFSFLMIASYLLFIRQSDWDNFRAWIRPRLSAKRLKLVYDGECGFCRSALRFVRFGDVFGLVTPLDYHDPAQLKIADGVREADASLALIALDSTGQQAAGFYAVRRAALRMPCLWPIVWIAYLPGAGWLGRRAYVWVARHRSYLPVARCCLRDPAPHLMIGRA